MIRGVHRWTTRVAVASLAAAVPVAASASTEGPTPALGCEAPGAVGSVPPVSAPVDVSASPAVSSGTDAPAAGDLDAWQAVDVALRATPGVAIDIGDDTEGGQDVWEVVVRQDDGSGVEHYIVVATGEILQSQPAQVPAIAATTTEVTLCDAIVIAAEAVDGGRVVEADLESEGGRTVWEVLVRTDREAFELYIDVTTGEILRQAIDD